LVAGWSDVGYTIRQLCLRHHQRIEGFAQQLDPASLCHQVPGEQMMSRSAGRRGAPTSYILGEGLSGVSIRMRVSSGENAKLG
jgi:hypothetical protein